MIKRVVTGYCWQYYVTQHDGAERKVLCRYKGPGDYVGIASDLLGINEYILESPQGCSFEQLPSDFIVPDVYLQKETRIALIHLRHVDNLPSRNENKIYTSGERRLDSLLVIRKTADCTDTSSNSELVPKPLNSTYSLCLPKELVRQNKLRQISPKTSSASNLSTFSTSLKSDVVYELSLLLRSLLSDSVSLASINRILHSSIGDDKYIHLDDLESVLTQLSLNFTLYQTSDNSLFISNKDVAICFSNNNLVDITIRSNLSKSIADVSDKIIIIPSTIFGAISFQSFARELATNPFSVGIILVSSLIGQLLAVANPLLFQQLIDKVINQQNPPLLPVIITLMVLTAILGGIFRSGRQLVIFDIADRADERFSEYVIRSMLALKYSFFQSTKKGDVAGRLSEVTQVRSFFTGPAMSTILDIVFSVLFVAILLLYSPLLTLVALSPLPIYMAIVIWGAPYYKKITRLRASRRASLISFLLEVISGVESVKLQSFKSKSIEIWRKKFRLQQETSLKLTTLGSVLGELGTFCTQLSGILILGFGTVLVLDFKLTIGELIAFRIISGFLTSPILRLSSIWQSFQETSISLERLNYMLDYPSERCDIGHSASDIVDSKNLIYFDNVTFGYSQDSIALSNISFAISPLEKIAIVGKSGSGKSTLMKIMTALNSYNIGSAQLMGKEIKNFNVDELRKLIYCVPQDSHFIGGTIEDNISYGYQDYTSSDLAQVLRDSCMEYLLETDLSFSFPVSEGGSNFSGGQRQRLALARMLLRKPKLILLDEATSALDSITEKQILSNIFSSLPDSTLVFITHRIQTAKSADRILVLDEGRLIAFGSYQQLIDTCPKFADMALANEDIT